VVSDLIVIGFDTVDDARACLKTLRGVEREGQVAFEDTAIVSKDASGKVHTHNEASGATETGAVAGAVLGGLLFFLFPIAGIALGAGAGALVGRLFNTGVDGKFVKEVREQLTPGTSALFLVIKGGNPAAVRGAFREYHGHGHLIQSSLDEELEAEIRHSLK
jgi:uncharacterized membrane protein